jgi:hypothetical protein
MAGGPVNGAPLTGVLDMAGVPTTALLKSQGDSVTDTLTSPVGIIIPTVLQTSVDLISWFSSITCLYNKHWYAEPERITLPIAFFNVESIAEDWQITTSKKRVILYEPDEKLSADAAANPVREGVMQTIVDNRVVEPKTYSMTILIPSQPLGRRFTEGVKTAGDMVFGVLEMLTGAAGVDSTAIGGSFADYARNLFSAALNVTGLIQTAAELAGNLPDSQGINYINKLSLEAMIESGLILTMKMWTGFDYKHVMITGGHIEKRPHEDDIFRGTLQLQEVPVLSITPPKDKKMAEVSRSINAIQKANLAMQAAVIAPLVQLTGVAEASGDTKLTASAVKGSLGL